MTYLRFKPFGGMNSRQGMRQDMRQDMMNRLFEGEGACGCHGSSNTDSECISDTPSTWFPTTDIYETDDEYVFKLEVPGLSKEDVSVELKDNTLSIKGELKEEDELVEDNFRRLERFSGSFNRKFKLPRDVDGDKIDAALKDGILRLRIGKAEEEKAKEIAISVN